MLALSAAAAMPVAAGQPDGVTHAQAASASTAEARRSRIDEIEQTLESKYGTIVLRESDKRDDYQAYYARQAARIERQGTQDFPMHEGRRVYGTARLAITIRKDGSIDRLEVLEASSPLIGMHARRTVRALAPLEPIPSSFPAGVKRVIIVALFTYAKESERAGRPRSADEVGAAR